MNNDFFENLYNLLDSLDNRRCIEKFIPKIEEAFDENLISSCEMYDLMDCVQFHRSLNIEPVNLFDSW
jgi:hypothetical protein